MERGWSTGARGGSGASWGGAGWLPMPRAVLWVGRRADEVLPAQDPVTPCFEGGSPGACETQTRSRSRLEAGMRPSFRLSGRLVRRRLLELKHLGR